MKLLTTWKIKKLTRTLGLSILILFAIIEVMSRLFLGNLNMPKFLIKPGDGRSFCFKPNTSVIYTGWLLKTKPVIQDVNGFGYRGEEISYRKSLNKLRIAVIGDSFTYGQGVKNNETIPAFLEKELNRSNRQQAEVLNFGIPGYNLQDYINQYNFFVRKWDPDIVLFLICFNDLDLSNGSVPLHNMILVFSSKYIYTLRVISFIWAAKTIQPPFKNEKEREKEFYSLLRKAKGYFRTDNVDFGIVILSNPLREGKSIEPISQSLGINYLDLSNILETASSPNLTIKGDCHYNALGCKSIALYISKWLTNSQIVAK